MTSNGFRMFSETEKFALKPIATVADEYVRYSLDGVGTIPSTAGLTLVATDSVVKHGELAPGTGRITASTSVISIGIDNTNGTDAKLYKLNLSAMLSFSDRTNGKSVTSFALKDVETLDLYELRIIYTDVPSTTDEANVRGELEFYIDSSSSTSLELVIVKGAGSGTVEILENYAGFFPSFVVIEGIQ